MSSRSYNLFIVIFLLLALNLIPTDAKNIIDLDETLKPTQTITWLEPSIIAKDDTFENITRIIASNDTLFGINHNSELVIFDISLIFNMSILSIETTYKYQNFVLDKNLLYLTHETGVAIFDVSNQNNIQYMGGNHTYFNTISHSGLTGIAVKDQIIYVGTKDNGIVLIDATNPSNPFIMRTYLDGADQSYDIIEIHDSILYVADYTGQSFKIIDISNPGFPTQIEYVTFGLNEFPNGMSITEYSAYISIDNIGIKGVNITDGSLHETVLSISGLNPVSIDAIDFYVVVTDVNDGILIFDLTQDEFNPVTSYNQSFVTVDVQLTQDLIFTANGLNGIRILDYGRDDDADGLTNGLEEYVYFTNPQDRDTDNDGVFDGEEVANGFNPLVSETSTTPNGQIQPNDTTEIITIITTQDESLSSLVVMIGILVIIGAVFFFQRRKSLRSKALFPKVVKKSDINKQKRTSVKNKIQSETISISLSCPSCGTTNPPQSSYCMQCGLFLD